jgi:7-cyano-7-deazaguanine synthase
VSNTSHPSPWPPSTPTTPLAVLVSGGVDSAVLLGEAVRAYPAVHPLYIRTGLVWEAAELAHLGRFLAAIRTPALQPLHILEQPVTDLYGDHWSLTGRGVPAAGTPDEDVFLPGRNVLLLAKSLLWCHLHAVPEVAMAPLAANPFPDATPEFFRDFAAVVNCAVGGSARVIRPYAHLHKTDVLRRGAGLPLELTFSCIRPASGRHCGRCSKCYERQQGFRDARIADPTDYAAGGEG